MARTLDRVKGRNSKQTWADHSLVKGLDERYAKDVSKPSTLAIAVNPIVQQPHI